MKKPLFALAATAALILAQSCVNDDFTPPAEPPLVVEGWIEEGQSPIVIVTHAVDLTQNTATFDDFVEKWCRVSVFDGDTRYVLTATKNSDYMPSFVFTASRLKGQCGHTYRLLVETETDTVEAVSTMPEAPSLLPLTAVKAEGSDSLYYIRADISGIDPDGYYRFYAQSLNEESRYYGTFMGTFKGSEYDPEKGWQVTRGIHSGYSDDSSFSHYYRSGDRVNVKLCALEPQIYEFWRVYDSNVSLSQNLFFTFSENCPGNIDGALGYWAACGTTRRTVLLP